MVAGPGDAIPYALPQPISLPAYEPGAAAYVWIRGRQGGEVYDTVSIISEGEGRDVRRDITYELVKMVVELGDLARERLLSAPERSKRSFKISLKITCKGRWKRRQSKRALAKKVRRSISCSRMKAIK